MIKARSTNHLLQSPAYPKILEEYNKLFKETGGKVNDKKFWEEYVKPRVENYPLPTWYGFIRRFKNDIQGLIVVGEPCGTTAAIQEMNLHQNLLSNEIATQRGIKSALNLGAQFYENLWNKYQTNPETLTDFEKRVLADALHKAMKSQDSRIHAIGAIKENDREQAKFDRAFQGAAFNEEKE